MSEYSPVDSKARDVAVFLRNADRLVKEDQYLQALEVIGKARALDPKNPYAIAYEERVKFLMQSRSDVAHNGPAASPKSQSPNQEEIRRAAIEEKVRALTASAKRFTVQGVARRAVDDLSRALLLAPSNRDLALMKEELEASVEQERVGREEQRKRQEDERRVKREEQKRQKFGQLQIEREERERRELAAREQARLGKIQEYLERSRLLLAEDRCESALREIGFVLVLESSHPEALSLRATILERIEEHRREEEERQRQRDEAEQQKKRALEAAVQKFTATAWEQASQGLFSEALRVITRAYVLDPGNEENAQCERQIIAMQEESLILEEARRRAAEEEERCREEEEAGRREEDEHARMATREKQAVEEHHRALQEQLSGHLLAARQQLHEGRFDEALTEIALAFLVDPFDPRVAGLEQEVLAVPEEEQRASSLAQEGSPTEDQSPNAVAQVIAEYVSEAERFRLMAEFDLAFESLAKAFILDPLNEDIQRCESAIDEDRKARQTGTPNRDARGAAEAPLPVLSRSHYETARSHLASGEFEDALAAVAMGLTIDDQNADLLRLEQEIWMAQSAAERRTRSTEAVEREREENFRLVQIHILAAEEFQKQNEFEKALDEIAKAYVIDPLSADIKRTEIRIRQNQAWSTVSGVQPLKLVYRHGNVADGGR